MPSKKQYNLVKNDETDTRIPLYSEEAFHRGIVFNAKFIGSMEVPKPTSRVEIVAAMRRIRYEFKTKGTKKRKVSLDISVNGLKVTLRKKKFSLLQKKDQYIDDNKLTLMHHPIYRIFYVSHDSHDLKIFSYIARDGTANNFKCYVFKSSKKSQAMRVVRTVGQAFEVCHKLTLAVTAEQQQKQQQNQIERDQRSSNSTTRADSESNHQLHDVDNDSDGLTRQPSSPSSVHKDISLLGDAEDSILEQSNSNNVNIINNNNNNNNNNNQTNLILDPHSPLTSNSTTADNCTSLIAQSPLNNTSPDHASQRSELTAVKHEILLLKERLEQQCQQTRAAVAQARLLQDQLAAETAARIEAQTRTHQLLLQNKELLEHIAVLVSHLREQERTPLLSNQTQIPSTNSLSTSTGVTDLSSLGQVFPREFGCFAANNF